MTNRFCLAALLSLAAGLSACSTMSVPNIDFVNLPDFQDDVENISTDFPSPDETPAIPDDVRSAEAWDAAARDMLALQDGFDLPEVEPAMTEEEFDRTFNALQARGRAYKADDPS